ncbi:hypothetical protein F5051DRAFT_443575 [Lentinula edodes]|nr:hypothetical protein F5051DRAFT_443575 [Lentinula edodes]
MTPNEYSQLHQTLQGRLFYLGREGPLPEGCEWFTLDGKKRFCAPLSAGQDTPTSVPFEIVGRVGTNLNNTGLLGGWTPSGQYPPAGSRRSFQLGPPLSGVFRNEWIVAVTKLKELQTAGANNTRKVRYLFVHENVPPLDSLIKMGCKVFRDLDEGEASDELLFAAIPKDKRDNSDWTEIRQTQALAPFPLFGRNGEVIPIKRVRGIIAGATVRVSFGLRCWRFNPNEPFSFAADIIRVDLLNTPQDVAGPQSIFPLTPPVTPQHSVLASNGGSGNSEGGHTPVYRTQPLFAFQNVGSPQHDTSILGAIPYGSSPQTPTRGSPHYPLNYGSPTPGGMNTIASPYQGVIEQFPGNATSPPRILGPAFGTTDRLPTGERIPIEGRDNHLSGSGHHFDNNSHGHMGEYPTVYNPASEMNALTPLYNVDSRGGNEHQLYRYQNGFSNDSTGARGNDVTRPQGGTAERTGTYHNSGGSQMNLNTGGTGNDTSGLEAATGEGTLRNINTSGEHDNEAGPGVHLEGVATSNPAAGSLPTTPSDDSARDNVRSKVLKRGRKADEVDDDGEGDKGHKVVKKVKQRKKRAVTKRAEYFTNIATDFPLHRQGLLYGYDGYIDIVPVPLVPQYNDPVDTAPQYVYTDFWIPPTFNGISTDKGTFACLGRHEVERFDGRGRRALFSIYTEVQGNPSVRERRLNEAIQRSIKDGTAPRGNVLVIKHWAVSREFTDIDCWDRITINDVLQSANYLFHRNVPTQIEQKILRQLGLREWTMLKRVSRFHAAEVSHFMDTRVVELLKSYTEQPLAFVNMLTKTKSVVGGQFVLRFLNVTPEKLNTPLLIFAPRLAEELWSDFMLKERLVCTVVRVPNIFEDYCAKYMKIEGKSGARIRILVGKRSSPLAMILGYGDTIGCSFINGSGVYVGYPDDVTEGKVVIGNTGPYAMPPLHGRREFRSATADDNAMQAREDIYGRGRW